MMVSRCIADVLGLKMEEAYHEWRSDRGKGEQVCGWGTVCGKEAGGVPAGVEVYMGCRKCACRVGGYCRVFMHVEVEEEQ